MGCYIKGLNKKEAENILRMCLYDNEVIEVPEPHGRLIDKDAILSAMTHYDRHGAAGAYVLSAPTVIEAEGA